MSYSFQVRKIGGTLELVTDRGDLTQIATHIPDGALFVISGHTPGPEISPVGQIQVMLMRVAPDGGPQDFIGSAAGSYSLKEPA